MLMLLKYPKIYKYSLDAFAYVFYEHFFYYYFSTWFHVFYEECGLCLVASFIIHVEMQTYVHILAYLVELVTGYKSHSS